MIYSNNFSSKTTEELFNKSIFQVQAEQKIAVMDKSECLFLRIKDISYIEANGSNSKLILVDNKSIMVSKNIKIFEEKLSASSFIRIHKSYLINILCISKSIKSSSSYVVMNDGAIIPISVRKRDYLIQQVGQHVM